MSSAVARPHVSAPMAPHARHAGAHHLNRETSVMTKIAFPLTLLATALVCALAAAPAQAQTGPTPPSRQRPVGLPGAGSCGSVQSPCRTLQAAFNVTAENGVIDVLDPGEYGPLTITHGVSIQGHGWATVTATSGATQSPSTRARPTRSISAGCCSMGSAPELRHRVSPPARA